MQQRKVTTEEDLEDETGSNESSEEDLEEEQQIDEEEGKALEKEDKSKLEQQEDKVSEEACSYIPFYKYTDLDNPLYLSIFTLLRILMCLTCFHNFIYPDQYWQTTEIAYNMVFGGVAVPWEWKDENRIRNVLYPLYLSIPLRILNFFKLDYYYTVHLSMQLFQSFIVILGDYYFYKVGCKTIGKPATRISLYIYVSSRFLNMHLLKCFGNSVETVLQMIIFYYYLESNLELFDHNICIIAILTAMCFMIRSTFLLGWPILILYKIFSDRAIFAFIQAAVLIGFPTLLMLVCIDSVFYNRFTFVPYNFLKKNIIDKVSENYGISPPTEYIFNTMPLALHLFFFITICGFIYKLYEAVKKREFPHAIVLICSVLLSFSMIPHKEHRFILPIIPFFILITAEFVYKLLLKFKKAISMCFFVIILWECLFSAVYYAFDQNYYSILYELMSVDPNPHQILLGRPLEFPVYSVLHMNQQQNRIEIFCMTFECANYGGHVNYEAFFDGWEGYWHCRDIVACLRNGYWPPKYVLVADFISTVYNQYSGKECFDALTQWYDLIRVYRAPYPEWKDFFGYAQEDYVMFQKKNSGEQFLLTQV